MTEEISKTIYEKCNTMSLTCFFWHIYMLFATYTYNGDGTITSTLDRDLDLNQNLNINNREYVNRLTENQRQLINKINPSDTILYEFTEYVLERNQEYSQILMQRDGAGFLSTTYTYGNQRINTESINNLSGIYTYDGRGSVSAVIGGWGDFRATYWYDGLGNVKSQIHGYGAFGSGKRYFGYNAEQYNPVTGNQNLRARQVNIRRQRFLSEDSFIGNKIDILSLNRYIYARNNPLKYLDPSGYIYDSVLYLIDEKGAHGLGHAAIMLVEDNGQAEYYSYAAKNENVLDQIIASTFGSKGYLSTTVNESGNNIKIDVVNDFINNYNSYENTWEIIKTDGVMHEKQAIKDKNGDFEPVSYSYAIYIPITDSEGMAMHNKALEIRENPGTYHLLFHNCNQVAQTILNAGGKDFGSRYFDGVSTIPNVVGWMMTNSIKMMNYIDSILDRNQELNIKDRMWFGKIGELCSLFSPTCLRKE